MVARQTSVRASTRASASAAGTTLQRMPAGDFEDPIEWIEHYWQGQDLGDQRKFLAMGSLLRLHQLMITEIDRVLKEFEITRSGYLVLATVQLSDDGTRLLSRIATHMLVHPTTVTLIVDKLEHQALLVRRPHPTDRRATHVKITPAGTALMKEATRALDRVGFGLPGLSDGDAAKLTKVLARIRLAAGDVDTVHGRDSTPSRRTRGA
ncbi:MAG: putative MarR family transcriptional regulator [Ilumatobacteraceae bacterium]|nr:putative MarR family transcriptional regulator [Ilumatobacteraceae bacterium]